MKNLLYLFLICLLFVSCGHRDKNISVIKTEFKQYVRKNFDDPKTMKEIAEIVPIDTISREKMQYLADQTVQLITISLKAAHLKDSILTKTMESKAEDLKKYGYRIRANYSDAVTASMKLLSLMSLLEQDINAQKVVTSYKFEMEASADSIIYSPPIYCYEIKYRQKESDGLKLKSNYAYVDSLSGFRVILPKRKDSDIICGNYKEVLDLSKKCLEAVDVLKECQTKYEDGISEINDILKKYNI